MKSNEIDQIIAEALEADKQGHDHHRHGTKKADTVGTIRKVLNVVFMVGFLAAVVIYFAWPENRLLFFCVGFGSVFIKLIEFFIRFML